MRERPGLRGSGQVWGATELRGARNHGAAASYELGDYEKVVVNSALWAAAGDALGWMTELSRGTGGVKYRTGTGSVVEPMAWKRLIGGKFGVTVDLPAGTYSDDTQLRPSVSRAIRGDGAFDVEAFAKIEVTVWQGYCLGAGIGSKAAASNLSKRGVNWFSNFFKTDRQSYTTAGGNGAAMRVQPHVWSARNSTGMLTNVLRDALVTHGHPHGFCGAVFHAMCLWSSIERRRIPTLDEARGFMENIPPLSGLVNEDGDLSSFWLPAWEREAGKSLSVALQQFHEEAVRDFELIDRLFHSNENANYHDILTELGCLRERYRGSGFKTAFAALLLAQVYGPDGIESALVVAANELDSDTDTIATMAGALLGAVAKRSPNWAVQDREYIEREAIRMAHIAFERRPPSFEYPDLAGWTPPSNQSDAIVQLNGSLALAGFGPVSPKSRDYESRGSVWQWFELDNSQRIFAKRRANSVAKASKSQFSPERTKRSVTEAPEQGERTMQGRFDFGAKGNNGVTRAERPERRKGPEGRNFQGLDAASAEVISSGFDDATLGRAINQCIDQTGSIEEAVSLSAIVAKAKLARKRRGKR